MSWKSLLTGIGIVDLMIVNAGLGYMAYEKWLGTEGTPLTANILTGANQFTCGEDCQKYIDDRIAQAQPAGTSGQIKTTPTQTPKPSPTAKPTNIPTSTPRPKVKTVSYVTVPGAGSTGANVWTTLTGTDFYFDPADYPGLKEIYFEANMDLFNGNGIAYVRLYDVTHGIGVQGSDVQTTSQIPTVAVSGQVTFWAGKNLIRVQAKSLTADTAIYNSGRLRVVTEN
jgi:hypothetical protein